MGPVEMTVTSNMNSNSTTASVSVQTSELMPQQHELQLHMANNAPKCLNTCNCSLKIEVGP